MTKLLQDFFFLEIIGIFHNQELIFVIKQAMQIFIELLPHYNRIKKFGYSYLNIFFSCFVMS